MGIAVVLLNVYLLRLFHSSLQLRQSGGWYAAAAYPTNFLRNIAAALIQSTYVLALDVDFIPSPGLHDSALAGKAH